MLGNDYMPSVNLPIDTLVMFAFYILLGAFAIFSIILYYHWKTYSINKKISGITMILYFASTIPLLLIMGITALII